MRQLLHYWNGPKIFIIFSLLLHCCNGQQPWSYRINGTRNYPLHRMSPLLWNSFQKTSNFLIFSGCATSRCHPLCFRSMGTYCSARLPFLFSTFHKQSSFCRKPYEHNFRLYRPSVEADMRQMQTRSHQKSTKIPPEQRASGVDALVRQSNPIPNWKRKCVVSYRLIAAKFSSS